MTDDDDLGLDVDDLETDTGHDDGNDGYPCPVDGCTATFDSKVKLGVHKRREHGILGRNASRRKGSDAAPDRPHRPNPATKSKRGRLVSETLVELVDLFERKSDNVDAYTLAGVIRRDADRIGDTVAALAERRLFAGLGPMIDALFGAGGPLSFVTALGPTLRKAIAARPARPRRGDQAADDLQAEYERIYHEQGPEAALTWAAAYGLEVH